MNIELTEEFVRTIYPEFRQPIKKIGRLRRFKGEELPYLKYSCVYFLVSKEGEVVYVGQTGNLLQRVASHQSNKDFSKVYYLLSPNKVNKETEIWRKKHKTYFFKLSEIRAKNQGKLFLGKGWGLKQSAELRSLQPEPSPFEVWLNETERKFILDYLPKYNNCGVKKKRLSDLAKTYEWLKFHRNKLNKLAKLV